ncbi:hypothetical protein AUQ54_01760 [Listeria monocytogenes]|nr:hypothetical protein [Listeria monocytogenes]
MTVKVGSTVKTTYKTKLINKGEIGTVDELAEFQKVKRETILFYATPTYQKRTTDKGLRVIRVD